MEIDIIKSKSILWEAIRIDCLGILELPLKTLGGNSSEKRLPT